MMLEATAIKVIEKKTAFARKSSFVQIFITEFRNTHSRLRKIFLLSFLDTIGFVAFWYWRYLGRT